ncbi:glycoside hydrolase family 1 protein [Glaciibacter psychrotolerans]|uniref:Beta-glucosidase n=1 Tax=Glaciibacter psychrotolerans TaxID=670054 RepID=A0A7Z0EF76_9MICO|nr:family 1 glycosylhydrolase [Leifsonia psychrotolerans]NYJ19847.1 beta-glucosidase [Leifsonia psychrotolerans]
MTRNSPATREWPRRASELGNRIPSDFTLGTTTSAFQVEGGARDGGRGESVWDVFTTQPERILDGSNASVSADQMGRLGEDVTLLRELGGDAYRFSFAWPRLQPDGRGGLNRGGIGFYDRLLDELLAAGIRPMATLSHWDTPLALRGGWLNRDTASRFGDYAHEMGRVFGDRLDGWVTLNEPATVMLNGYMRGTHAPGARLLFDALPAGHHQLLAHGLAVQGLRAADVRGQIGIAQAHTPVQPASDREEDGLYAELYDLLHNRLFADAVLLGRYPAVAEPFERELRMLTESDPDDLATIHQPLDFYGLNYSQPSRVAAGPAQSAAPGEPAATDGSAMPAATLPFHLESFREHPLTALGWPNAPEYLGVSLRELRDRYGDALPPVYLTEGGASFADRQDAHGVVDDTLRIDYLAEHLSAALDAVAPGGVAEGVALRGYFVRSLLDGFEWDAGYTQRFGLVWVDFADQSRTPKSSYRWLQKVLAARS